MRFAARAVDVEVFEQAPWRFQNVVELDASAEEVFSILEDPDAWPRWFDGIQRVEWTTPKPFGVGTTRTVWLTTLTVDEYFFRWEPGRRFSFYVTSQTFPMARVLAEDYLLEPLGAERCRFTYTVAVEPRLLTWLVGPLARRSFASMFAGAVAGLQAHVATAPA